MSKEIYIGNASIACLFQPQTIQDLCKVGYLKTNQKFTISFNGSKGYLSHIAIECEGVQKANNRIYNIFRDGAAKEALINIYYSKESGVRIENNPK